MATHLDFNNGMKMPSIGLGTWKSAEKEVENAVKAAIDAGYRHIDTAWAYGNENEVGEAIKAKIADGTVTREELFVTTKIWNTKHEPADVRPAVLESLRLLQLDYVDLFLVHWPIAWRSEKEIIVPRDENGKLVYVDLPYLPVYKILEDCVDEGLMKSIGVSNFNSEQLQDILNNCRIKPVNNQIEIHPYLSQEPITKFCQEKGITVTAYSSLGSPDRPWGFPNPPSLLTHETIKVIADAHNKSNPQVILRWLLQRKICVIPKSVTPSRITQNLDVFDFSLTDEEMATMASLNRDLRLITYANGEVDVDKTAPYFPFNIPF